jgi:hypothetical protein
LPTAGGAAQPDPGRTHPQRHEPGGQRLTVGAFAPGDRRGCRLAHVQHQLPQRRAALAVARPGRRPRPAYGTVLALDRGGHTLGEPAAHRGRVPGALVDELLQRLLDGVGAGVTAG